MDIYNLEQQGAKWTLRKEGARYAVLITDSKSLTFDMACVFMRANPGILRVYRTDGRLEEERAVQDGPNE